MENVSWAKLKFKKSIHTIVTIIYYKYVIKQRCNIRIRKNIALPGVGLLLGNCPENRKVIGSITSQGTRLGCAFVPQLGHVRVATNRSFSPSLFLCLPHSLKK